MIAGRCRLSEETTNPLPERGRPHVHSDAAEALACLLSAAQELHSASDLQTGLERVAARIRQDVPYDNLGVLLLDDLGRELRFSLAVGYPGDVVDHWRFGLGQGIVGTVAQTGEGALVDDVTVDGRYIQAAPETRSEIALPLKVQDRIIGVLDLGSRQPGAFTATDMQLLEFLAGTLASAIESQRLLNNLRSQARTLSALHEIGRELTSILDRKRLLERVAERLRSLIPYDALTVLLWSDGDERLEPWVSVLADRLASENARAMRLGEGICGTAAALRQPIRVPNVHLDPRYVSCNPKLDVRSEIAVPLTFEDRLLGVLDLESTRSNAFTLAHEQLLATLGASLSIALANAEMYETLRGEQQRVEADLETARSIQRSLLPGSTPWVKELQIAVSWSPARELGGDFYDFLPYGEERIAFAVGDVAGKATPAALYGALAVGMLRELATQDRREPAEVLSLMNVRLRDLGIPNRFVALAFGVFDPKGPRLRLANSGLPYPYLLRKGSIQELEAGGVPLGLLPDSRYEALEVALEPEDTLVLASDGISEALNSEEAEFGSERVRSTLRRLAGGSAREIADGLTDAVCAFSGKAEISDDRTVLALKVCDGPCSG